MWGMILKFFLNPKVLMVLAVAGLLGGAYYKWNSLQKDLAEAKIALKQEKDNNVILRGNIETITKVNQENTRVIEEQAQAAKTAMATIAKLNSDSKRSNNSFNSTVTKIDAIKIAPVPLSPFLKEAIIGIQAERDLANPKGSSK